MGWGWDGMGMGMVMCTIPYKLQILDIENALHYNAKQVLVDAISFFEYSRIQIAMLKHMCKGLSKMYFSADTTCLCQLGPLSGIIITQQPLVKKLNLCIITKSR